MVAMDGSTVHDVMPHFMVIASYPKENQQVIGSDLAITNIVMQAH
jgi:hypothetical protein